MGNLSYQTVYNTIFDTGALVYTITDKSQFTSYKLIYYRIGWGKATTLDMHSKGTIIIKFSDINKVATLKKCYYISQLGINIIAATTLLPDILQVGGNNTLIITKNNIIITKAYIK